MNRTFNVTTRY